MVRQSKRTFFFIIFPYYIFYNIITFNIEVYFLLLFALSLCEGLNSSSAPRYAASLAVTHFSDTT